MKFEDHFSRQAKEYAQYRPHHPAKLFKYLASITPEHKLVWDCGTGNGQAAIELTRYFEKVIATDASSDQIFNIFKHKKIDYRIELAEKVSLDSASVDLVTVAVAVHWFDLNRFYSEVKRILKPNGVLAVWTYFLSEINPEIDQILMEYFSEILKGYWPSRIQYVQNHYKTLPFHFDELTPPVFTTSALWNLDQTIGFLTSWSATQKYIEKAGHHPVELIWPKLETAWGEAAKVRKVQWQLYMRVGKV